MCTSLSAGLWLRLGLAAATCLAACSESRRASPVSVSAYTEPRQSRGLLITALDHFAPGVEGRLLVDPRPLRSDADLADVTAAEIAVEDAATAELRTAIVRERGIGLTDAADDQRCAFARGLQMPDYIARTLPDSVNRRHEECLRRGIYTSLIFGLPEPAEERAPGVWRLKAVRLTTWYYSTWDLYLRPAGDGDWVIVEAKRIIGIAS